MKRLAYGIASKFDSFENRTLVFVSSDPSFHVVPLPCGAEKQWSDRDMLDYTRRYIESGCGAGYRHQNRLVSI